MLSCCFVLVFRHLIYFGSSRRRRLCHPNLLSLDLNIVLLRLAAEMTLGRLFLHCKSVHAFPRHRLIGNVNALALYELISTLVITFRMKRQIFEIAMKRTGTDDWLIWPAQQLCRKAMKNRQRLFLFRLDTAKSPRILTIAATFCGAAW